MPLADTSRVQLRYIEETGSFGVTPGAGNGINLRMTGESLDYNVQTDSSQEIRGDRQKNDLVVIGASSGGGFNFEFSYNEYDKLLEAALQGTWSVYGTNGVGTTFAGTWTANTLTAGVAPVGANAFTTLAQGQWFQAQAGSGANAGKYFKVHEVTAPTATVITLSALTPATVEGPIANTALSTSRLVNGSTQRSYTMEKAFQDIAQFFFYRGMTASKVMMSLQSGKRITGSFDFLGKDGGRAAATTLPGAPVASKTFEAMNAVRGVGNILEGGALLTGTFIKSLEWGLDNSLRGRDAIGTLGNVSIGAGTIDLSGTMLVYLADGTLYDKFLNNTATSLSFRMVDAAGNGYIVTLPRVEYKDAKVQAGSINQDAMLSLPFEANQDATSGKTILVDRVGVAAL
jgi:hypothetical protein